MKRSINKHEKGVALLMALGVLALLSILGISFATSMRLGEKGCQAFVWNIQARYIAEGGIARAIADLKYNVTQGAVSKFMDDRNEGWFYKDGPGADIKTATDPAYKYPGTAVSYMDNACYAVLRNNIRGTTKIKILDTASQININDWKNPDLPAILGSLGLPADAVTSFTDYIKPAANKKPFTTKQDIELVPNVGPATYKAIKDYITTSSYKDPNNNDKAAINVNTASKKVLSAVFNTILNNPVKSDTLANAVIAEVTANGSIKSWKQFNDVVKKTLLVAADANNIIAGVNPNQTTIDRTKLNFNSGGTYEIECLAKVGVSHTQIGTLDDNRDLVLSEKRIKTVVKIFDMWNVTTTQGFQGETDMDWDGLDAGEDVNGNGVLDEPIYSRVTWLDSCPVDLDNSYPSSGFTGPGETINGSVKLGFWDDFNFWDRDGNLIQDRWNYSKAQWYNQQGRYFVSSDGHFKGTVRSGYTTNDPDSVEFYAPNAVFGDRFYPTLCLGRTYRDQSNNVSSVSSNIRNRWVWDDFSLRLYFRSYRGIYNYNGGAVNDIVGGNPLAVPAQIQWRSLPPSGGIQKSRKYDSGAVILLKRTSEDMRNTAQRSFFINHKDPWLWDRTDPNSINAGMSAGRWGGVIGAWNVNNNAAWGRTYILADAGGHEGVTEGFNLDQKTTRRNDDINKNMFNYPYVNHLNHDNDNHLVNTGDDVGVGSDVVDNIDSNWENIYYYPYAFPRYSYLCLGSIPKRIIGGEEVDDDTDVSKLNKYYDAGQYNILYNKQGGRDILSAESAQLYDYNDARDDLLLGGAYNVSTFSKDAGANITDGNIALHSNFYFFTAKNIRIMGKTGFYSSAISLTSPVEWGSIFATETMPSTANGNNEKIAFQVSPDGTDWYPNDLADGNYQFSRVDSQLQPESGSIFSALPVDNRVSANIRYRANFVTSDLKISETPVLEDVWITYLPKTKILYWREN